MIVLDDFFVFTQKKHRLKREGTKFGTWLYMLLKVRSYFHAYNKIKVTQIWNDNQVLVWEDLCYL